jgi:hypothetical protein
MSPIRLTCLVIVTLSAAMLAGCYGSTERATDVGLSAVTLHGKGTANNGPVQTFFEYWPTAEPSNKETTPPQPWPSGASGPFSQSVAALRQGTKYTFRLCGNDEGQSPVCAQTRTFETQSPDSAAGMGTAPPGEGQGEIRVTLHASSGPSGQEPGGTMLLDTVSGPPAGFVGHVSCLTVTGSTARLAATGKPFVGSTVGPFTTMYAKVVVGSSGERTFDWTTGELSATPDCAAYDGGGRVATGDFTVTDSQPPEPPS